MKRFGRAVHDSAKESIMSKANLIAAFLICAFVIDRLVTSLYFLASYRDAAQREENNKKLLRFALSGVLAAVAVYAFDFLRILNTVWKSNATLDAIATWLVLVAGAEKLSSFIGDRAADAKPATPASSEQTLRVTGTMQVDKAGENILRMQHS
jgi:hypothetical protein